MAAGVWVVIPTYNEADNVEPIVRATIAELQMIAPGDHRVLIVDDNSPDGTGAIADRLAGELEASKFSTGQQGWPRPGIPRRIRQSARRRRRVRVRDGRRFLP